MTGIPSRAVRPGGQRLFFNQAGERASLTGTRMSDFQRGRVERTSSQAKTEETSAQVGEEAGLNMFLLIQVPLKHEPLKPAAMLKAGLAPGGALEAGCLGVSAIEEAVIGHGKVEGPFTEIDGLAIERDPRYPVRVTVQFYQATSNGVISPADMERFAREINNIYAHPDYVGSLVTEGHTYRPTEYEGSHQTGGKHSGSGTSRKPGGLGRRLRHFFASLQEITGFPPTRISSAIC